MRLNKMSRSLEEEMTRMSRGIDNLESQITDIHLEELARSFLKYWRGLPSHLNLEGIVVSDIERQCSNEPERRKEFLQIWRQRFGSEATYRKLIQALLVIECREDAEAICRLLRGALPEVSSIPVIGRQAPFFHELSQEVPRVSSNAQVCDSSVGQQQAQHVNFPFHMLVNPIGSVKKFPYLTLGAMSVEERRRLIIRLEEESENITLQYARLVVLTATCLEERGIAINKLRTFFGSCGLSEIADKIQPADSVHDIVGRLTQQKYMTFFNYKLLEAIIKTFCYNEIGSELANYESCFSTYCQRRIFEVPASTINAEASSTCQQPLLVLKFDDRFNMSDYLHTIHNIRHRIEQLLGLEYLNLVDVRNGCIELKFQYFVKHEDILVKIKQKFDEFLQLGVKRLQCGQFEVYFDAHPNSGSAKAQVTSQVIQNHQVPSHSHHHPSCGTEEQPWPDIQPTPSPVFRYDLTQQYGLPVYQPSQYVHQPRSPVYHQNVAAMSYQPSPSPRPSSVGLHPNYGPPHPLAPMPQQPRDSVYSSKLQSGMSRHQPSKAWKRSAEYAAGKETFEKRLKEELKVKDIKVQLTRQNYKEKFSKLIRLEERSHIEVLKQKCNQRCDLVLYQKGVVPEWIRFKEDRPQNKRYGHLQDVGADRISYATQAAAAAFVVAEDESIGCEVKLEILAEYSDENLYVSYYEDDTQNLSIISQSQLPDESVHLPGLYIEFKVKHSYFNMLVKAVNKISPMMIERIVPQPSDFCPLIKNCTDDYIDSLLRQVPGGIKIDQDQFRALRTVLLCARKSPPVIVNGSFGTGKTRLLAITTFCIIKHGINLNLPVRVLICAHHQASADHFIQEYFGRMFMHSKNIELIRLTSQIHFRRSEFSNLFVACRTYIRDCKLHRRGNSNYLVIVTTFNTASHLSEIFDPGFFTHILIDEGSQAREPEAISPLCLAGPDTKVVIAGDSCQVGPSLLVLGEEARENGLKYSLMERLQALYEEFGGSALQHMISLNTNYRCHQDLIQISNDLFYESKVLSPPSHDVSPHPLAMFPLIFVCSSTTAQVNCRLEAQILLEQVQYFAVSHWPKCWGTYDLNKVCLTTSSQFQHVITKKLAKQHFNMHGLRMLTTFKIQGEEFQALFLGATEPVDSEGNTTNPTKSPCDPYVFNTVLTRSKSLVVVVGSPLALLGIEEHMVKLYGEKARCWSSYIRVCLKKGTFIIPPLVEEVDITAKEFELRLKAKLFDSEASKIATKLADSIARERNSLLRSDLQILSPHVASSAEVQGMPAPKMKSRKKPSSQQPVTVPEYQELVSKQQELHSIINSECAPSKTADSSVAVVRQTPVRSSKTNEERNVLVNDLAVRQVPVRNSGATKLKEVKDTAANYLAVRQDPVRKSTLKEERETVVKYFSVKQGPLRNSRTERKEGIPTTSSSTNAFKSSAAAMNSVTTPFAYDDYPTLGESAKVSKKDAKKKTFAEGSKNRKQQSRSISSKNVSVPTKSSSFYADLKEKMDPNSPLLREEITARNYKEKFHHLLCWEEQEHARQLSERCNKVYQITVYQNGTIPKKLEYEQNEKYVRYGHITSDDGDTLVHAKQASQGSYIVLESSYIHARHVFGTVPYKANFNAIIIAFTFEEHEKLKKSASYKKISFDIEAEVHFELKHEYFSRLHRAVKYLPTFMIEKLTPTEEMFASYQSKEAPYHVYPPDFDSIELDKEMQLRALQTILNSTSDVPILVAGPFGTGKTRLLARAAYEVLKWKKSRVLICAHHQASVDTFVDKYFGPMIKESSAPWNVNMIRIIPNDSYSSDTRNRFGHFFKSQFDLTEQDLLANRLIITTLGTAQRLYYHIPADKKKGFFTHILIDEGAQTREPETLGPLCLAGKFTTVVITGDHRQVGPRLLVLGDIPQANGLGVSLLERLHALYDTARNSHDSSVFDCCSATLLTNYRCHSGILMLPSSLYYHSTLLCRVPENRAHHLAPFPLTFISSDIRPEVKCTSGVNEKEADILIEEVKKYFKEWPKHWDADDKRICIMSPSANQCTLIRKRASKLRIDCEVEVLKAYDIQGTEFPAIFISTSELTDENGNPINTTKAISDRFVFNTALTRSRSLVVAVGNPFSLLKMEESMIKKHDSSYKSWKPYIKQCIECNTFSYAEVLKNSSPSKCVEATHQLYKAIYPSSVNKPAVVSRPLDTIISDYKKVFEEIPACKKAKLTLSAGKDSQLAWNIEDKSDDSGKYEEVQEIDFADQYLCQLRIDTFRKAEAIPFDKSKKIVKIRGVKNRKGAFDGETVEVGIFSDDSLNTDQEKTKEKCYGRVLKAVRASNDLKFVCQILFDNPIVFYPVDRKNPKLINLPRLSRDLLQKKDRNEINQSELKSTDVVVFDPDSYNVHSDDVPLPRISQVIPLSMARNMLFLVSFVRWEEKYYCPLGIVVGAYRKGHTPYNADRLLKIVHSVEYTTDDGEPTTVQAVEDPSLKFYDRVFTIDPEEALNLDDALSLVFPGTSGGGQDVYQLGVHIVNAAKHIQPGSETDEFARNVGVSVYGGERGKIMHMLNSSSTRHELSLIPGELRDVVSVTCNISFSSLGDFNSVTFGECDIHPAQIKSSIQLTYKHAQTIMDGGSSPQSCADQIEKFDSDLSNPSLQNSLKLLYGLARVLRQQRKQSDAAFSYDVNGEEEACCWQTHMLVEELMIWANRKVAEQLHEQYPDLALLRRQAAPNLERKQAIVEEDHSIMLCSLSLGHYLRDTDFEDALPQNVDITMPLGTLNQILRALEDKNQTLLAHLLSADRLYPQLAAITSKFRSILLRAEYCCTQRNKTDPSAYRHDSLCLDNYTHFTSPMRRYFDIEVQRLLLELSEEARYHDDCEKFCMLLNAKMRNAKEYNRVLTNTALAFDLLNNGSKIFTASISQKEMGWLELGFADLTLSDFPTKAKKVKIASFIPFDKIADSEQCYLWKLRITTLQGNLAGSLLEHSNPPFFKQLDSGCEKSLESTVKAYYYDDGSDDSRLSTDDLLIPPASLAVSIPSHDWLAMLRFVREPTVENMEQVRAVLSKSQSSSGSSRVLKVAPKRSYPLLDCDVKSTLKESDVMKVWVTWSMREPVISPAIQLVEVSPLLRVCLQHNTHPAECFSNPNLPQASLKTYKDAEDYVTRWKIVLLAEASEQSVKNCQPTIIRDVHLEWPKLKIPDGCTEQIYYVPSKQIKLTVHRDFVEHCYEFCKMSVGDLVCVRYGYEHKQSLKAVYHFVIDDVELDRNKNDKAVIYLEAIGEANCRVSEAMKEKLESADYPCEIQVITLDYSHRKVYRELKKLLKPKEVSTLALNVAVDPWRVRGKNMYSKKNQDSILKKDKLALSISLWSSSNKKSTELNDWQKEAMGGAIQDQFQLIQGPPGTGKSVTGAHIAYVFAKLNKSTNSYGCVLYCGPSNKSVDVVFEKFVQLLSIRKDLDLKILRIYSKAIERKDYPAPKRFDRQHKADQTCPDWAKPYALHHLMRKNDCYAELLELESGVNIMKQNKQMASGKRCSNHTKALWEATENFLTKMKFDVVFCTCNEAASSRVRQCLSPRQCIIDECGMAYEPETIVPISLCEHVVLIGDHKQLQPVIDYQPARDHGLTTSLFERYATHYEDRICTLKTQYRMHEAICAFPSEEFYDGELETDDSVKNRPSNRKLEKFWPSGSEVPIMFVDVVGSEGQDMGSSKNETKVGVDSKFNMEEVELVILVARSLLSHDPDMRSEDVAILTPYSAQKNKLLERVKMETGRLRNIKVASVTESQGDEYGYVILSTVRSQPLEEIRYKHYVQPDRSWMKEHLGFITDRHQINVGITRSKYGLIITGNETLLKYNSTWERLLEHYDENGCIVSASHFKHNQGVYVP